MSDIEQLKAFVFERLTATAEEIFGVFEKVIQDHDEKESRSKREIERQNRLLDIFLKPDLKIHTAADPPQLSLCKEEVPHEQQERSPSLGQEDPEAPQIKEEQEETWSSQEGEQLQGLREADTKDSTFTITSVRSLHDQHQRQAPHLYQAVENREEEPLPSTSTEHMETEADGGDCGGSQPTTDLQLLSSDCSVAESDDTDRDEDWTERGGHPSDLKTKTTSKTAKRESSGVGSNGRTSMESVVTSASRNAASCMVCGEAFTTNARLIQHVETHSKDAPCACGVCGKHVESTESLVDHLTSHKMSEIPLRPYSCSVCHKEFHSIKYKAAHMRTHAGHKLYTCSICNKKFTLQCYLTSHLNTHTGDRPHICHFCGKGFNQVGNMNTHMRIHTGERRHTCGVCGQAFNQVGNMKRHMRIHTGEKPHGGTDCGKRFAQGSILFEHLRIHTGERPYI